MRPCSLLLTDCSYSKLQCVQKSKNCRGIHSGLGASALILDWSKAVFQYRADRALP
ncbi:unnamed protein product, partial [Mycena citricolor]